MSIRLLQDLRPEGSGSCAWDPALRVKTVAAQGWGNILNLVALLFFLGVQGQTGPTYSASALSLTWRMQYALGLLPICFMLYHRIFRLQESAVWQVLPACCRPAVLCGMLVPCQVINYAPAHDALSVFENTHRLCKEGQPCMRMLR